MVGEWRDVSIEEIASKIAMGPFGSDIKTDNFVPAGVPVIRGGNLTAGRFNGADFVFLTEAKADQLANANALPGDLVFTHRGTLGQVGLVPAEPFTRYVVSQSQMKLRCDPKSADPTFIYYFFRSPAGQHALLMNTSQTGVPAISRPTTSLKSIRLSLPPLPEQRAIAHILGTLDDKIELNRRMNETLEAMVRTLFKSWFVDFDPVRAKSEDRDPSLPKLLAGLFPESFEDSELGKIPKGWRVCVIRDLAGNIQYGFTQSASPDRAGPRFLRITDIQGGKVNWATVPSCEVTPEEHEKYRLKPGDVLVARTGASTGENIYLSHAPDAVFASYLVRFQFLDLATARLVGAFMRTQAYFEYVAGGIGGSAQPNASAQVLAGAQLVLPTPSIASMFADFVMPLDVRIAANANESRTLTAVRDALLPKLISGEVRVRDAEQFARNAAAKIC